MHASTPKVINPMCCISHSFTVRAVFMVVDVACKYHKIQNNQAIWNNFGKSSTIIFCTLIIATHFIQNRYNIKAHVYHAHYTKASVWSCITKGQTNTLVHRWCRCNNHSSSRFSIKDCSTHIHCITRQFTFFEWQLV